MRSYAALSLAISVLSVGLQNSKVQSEDVRAKDVIEEAINLLELRKIQAENPAEQAKIVEAITAMQKLLPKEKAEPVAGSTKKKLAGKAVYNPKTKELTVAYDFSDKNQLSDFAIISGKPQVQARILKLEAGEGVRHVAHFKTVSITGLIQRNTRNGPQVGTTSGAVLGCGGGIHLKPSAKDGWMRGGDHPRGDAWTFRLSVEADRVALKVEGIQVGKSIKTASAGQVELHGGEGGAVYTRIVLTGEVDEDWAKTFFGQ